MLIFYALTRKNLYKGVTNFIARKGVQRQRLWQVQGQRSWVSLLLPLHHKALRRACPGVQKPVVQHVVLLRAQR